jgi:spore maturation protein SpmA
MALSRIWTAFILIAILVAAGRLLFEPGQDRLFTNMVAGKGGKDTAYARYADSASIPKAVHDSLAKGKAAFMGKNQVAKGSDGRYAVHQLLPTNGVFETAKSAVIDLCIPLIGIMALFMGFMSIAERAGGVRFLSRIIGPFFSKIFPDVPKNHPSMGHMVMNFSANLMGLDNAATPFGIKAMESLQEINPDKTRASNPQLMFLCLHASGLTLIPISIIADRVTQGSNDPTIIFIPCMIATFAATIAAMTIVSIRQGIRLFNPVILLWVFGITAAILALILYINKLSSVQMQVFSGTLSNGIILLVFLLIVLGGIYKKINIFDAFIDGAKQGLETTLRLIPYLVGLLVAISLFRNSGAFDFILDGIKALIVFFNGEARVADALPTALVKPLSGSGARALMIDTMKVHGPDSFAGNLASVFRGSSDTTFYIIAVYFGAVGIKNSRYAIPTMLLADLAGIITAIGVCYIFFG